MLHLVVIAGVILTAAPPTTPPLPESTKPLKEPAKPAAEPKKMSFKMKDVPWDDVLEWYAKESGLTPIYNVKPTGKFTFIPPKADTQYTLAEITDILNEAMASQKFILIRRQMTFTIVPSDEKIDTLLVRRIELAELSTRGKTELVQVLIPLNGLDAEDTAPEIEKMLTPFGSVSKTKSNTLVIVDTAGNIQRLILTLQT